ncbi:hypothetical protein AAF712_008446 [Marasmius tenuissimus]|uniref:F-box domain-containing protein n=1 Tax=Marasmius tenuissimus TaxID=585030 RepID=A0ABR2ZSG4_9AGAR
MSNLPIVEWVPPETLRQIFAAACDSYEDDSFELNPMNPHAQVHVIRNVSKKWRIIMDTQRDCWKRVSFAKHLCVFTKEKAHIVGTMISRWLLTACGTKEEDGHQKSKQHISFYFRTVFINRMTVAERISVRYLNMYSMFWNRAVLETDPSLIVAFGPAHSRVGNLTSLHLIFPHGGDSSDIHFARSAMMAFEVAPKLKHLYFGGRWDPTMNIMLSVLPWSQITHVEVAERYPFDFYHIMKHATSATTAIVQSVPIPVSNPGAIFPEPLDLPKLEKLLYTAQYMDPTYAPSRPRSKSGLFRYLKLRGLKHLEVDGGDDERVCREVLDMIGKSGSDGTCLVLKRPQSDGNWIADRDDLNQAFGILIEV